MLNEIVGFSAGFVGAIMTVPQVYKVVVTKSTKDISLLFVFLNLLCSVLWLWYGILIMDWPIIITDVALGVQFIIIALYKIYFDIIKKDENTTNDN